MESMSNRCWITRWYMKETILEPFPPLHQKKMGHSRSMCFQTNCWYCRQMLKYHKTFEPSYPFPTPNTKQGSKMVYTQVGGHNPLKTLMETISEHPLIGSKVENGWKWKEKIIYHLSQNNHFESLWAMFPKKVWWDLHLISQQLPQALSNLIPKQPLDCSSPEGIGSLDSFFPGRGVGSKMVYTQVGGHNPPENPDGNHFRTSLDWIQSWKWMKMKQR